LFKFAIHGLALVTINLSTKFDVFISTQDTIDNKKYRQWGGLGLLGVTEGHWK